MKKKILAMMLALTCVFSMTACGGNEDAAEDKIEDVADKVEDKIDGAQRTTFKIASMKGPTTMGLVKLMKDAEEGKADHDYQVTMYGTADEFTAQFIKGDIDVALVPCNLASVLYAKTGGKIEVSAINTLGVLSMVENGNTINSVADLKGKTIVTTGKGTTPEFVLNYILEKNGLKPGEDVTIEFKSEATEVAALMETSSEPVIAMLPQPYVTTLQVQNQSVRTVLDMTREWDKVSTDSKLVTGVVVSQKSFVENNREAFEDFLDDYEDSTEFVNERPEEAATYVAEYGIVPKAEIALKAIPNCNITFITDEEMQQYISGYLKVLEAQNPQSIGGKLPDEGFYYVEKD